MTQSGNVGNRLLDDLVGAGEDGRGYDGTQTSRLPLVHGQLPIIRLLNWKISRWGALEYAGGVFANAALRIVQVVTITQRTPDPSHVGPFADSEQTHRLG